MPKSICSNHPLKISIVTVVRNGKEFVEQTIRSVLGQHYKNIEYIVIDGGSTDGTVNIIKKHESGIAKWLSEKDAGIADAFNKGFSFSTGDYLLFLNADDALAAPDVVDQVVQKIAENNYPPLLYGDCDLLDRRSGEVLYRTNIEVPHKNLLLGAMIPQPSLFTHRSYFEKYGVFDLDFRIAMDYEWLLRGGITERIIHVPLLLTNIRDGGVSTLDRGRVVNEIVSALKKNGYVSSRWAEFNLRGYFLVRAVAKSILEVLGLYKAFDYLRKK